jgi:hypothetical protein
VAPRSWADGSGFRAAAQSRPPGRLETRASHEDLARKLDALKKHDAQFRVAFDAIRQLKAPPTPEQKKQRIGFRSLGEPD